MKSIITEGTRGRAACERCGGFVAVTYRYGPVQLGELVVDDVMRATCDTCGAVVATAPQSAHRFRSASESRRHRRTTVRMPQELLDFVSLQLSLVGADSTHEELYFRALLLACRGNEEFVGRELLAVEHPVLLRPNRASVNLTLGPQLRSTLGQIQLASGNRSTADVLRRLLVLADGALENRVLPEIERLACAYA